MSHKVLVACAVAVLLSFAAAQDVAPPLFLTGYPSVYGIDCRVMSLKLVTNEDGLAFCLALPSTARAPKREEVRSGAYNGTASAPIVWARVSLTANMIATTTMTGLKSNTQYTVYCVSQDRVPNLQLLVASQTFATLPDSAPPTWISTYPRITRTSLSAVSMLLQASEDCTVFWAIAPAGQTPPSSTQLVAGQVNSKVTGGSVSVPQKAFDVEIEYEQLQPTRSYDFFMVAKDGDGFLQAVATRISFVTNPAPEFETGFPRFSFVLETSAYMEVRLDKTGTLHFCVQRPNSAPPTPAMVRAGSCNSMIMSNHMAISSVGATFAITLTGLSAATTYTIYSAPEDTNNNLAYTASEAFLTTVGADVSFDGFAPGYPAITMDASNFVTMQVRMQEAGVFYACITQHVDSPVPTVQSIKDGNPPYVITCGSCNAGATALSSLSMVGLTADTRYYIRYVGYDSAGNTQATVASLDFTTAADNAAPQFLDGFPAARSIKSNSFRLDVATNEAGVLFYAVLDAKAPLDVPGTTELTSHHVSTAYVSGSFFVNTPNVVYNTTVIGLPGGTDLFVYCIMVDSRNNVQDTPTRLMITTPAEVIPTPDFAIGFPRTMGMTDTSAVFEMKLNMMGKVFFTVLDPTVPPPTPTKIRDGTLGVAGSAVEPTSLPIVAGLAPGLTPSTKYVAYFITQDSRGNLRESPTPLQFITPPADVDPPVFINGFPTATPTDTSVRIDIQLNEPATVYCLVVTGGSVAPTVSNVLLQSGGVARGVVAVSTGVSTTSLTLSGLTPTTVYTVYLAMQDLKHNVVTDVVHTDFTTTTDSTPPNFVVGYPSVGSITDKSATLSVIADESGQISYCLIPMGATVTVAQVRTQTCPSALASGFAPETKATAANLPVANVYLQENTNYQFAVVLEDTLGNIQDTPKYVSFATTADQTMPTSSSIITLPPSSQDATTALISVSVTVSEPCQLRWLILPQTVATPVSANIVAGVDGSGQVVSAAGMLDMSSAPLTKSFTVAVSSLPSASAYQLYTVAVDMAVAHNTESPPSSNQIAYTVNGGGGGGNGGSQAGQISGGGVTGPADDGTSGMGTMTTLIIVALVLVALVIVGVIGVKMQQRRNAARAEKYKAVEGIDDTVSVPGERSSGWMEKGPYDSRSRRSSYTQDDRPGSQDSRSYEQTPREIEEDEVEDDDDGPHVTRSAAPVMAMPAMEMLDLEQVLQEAENVSKRVMARPLEELAADAYAAPDLDVPGSVRPMDEDEDAPAMAVSPVMTRSAPRQLLPRPASAKSSSGVIIEDDGELDLEPVLAMADRVTRDIGGSR